jgi:hypothetical protein
VSIAERMDRGRPTASVMVVIRLRPMPRCWNPGWTWSSVITNESSSQPSEPVARRYGSTTVDHQCVRLFGSP